MSKGIANWAAEQLAGDEILLPVKRLWVALNETVPGHGPALDAFAALLEADERFAPLDPDEQFAP